MSCTRHKSLSVHDCNTFFLLRFLLGYLKVPSPRNSSAVQNIKAFAVRDLETPYTDISFIIVENKSPKRIGRMPWISQESLKLY